MQKTSTNELEQPVLEGNDRLGGTWIAATPTATLQLYPFHDNEEVIDEFTTVLLIMFGQSERARTQADFFSKLPEDLELERKRHRDDRHPLSVQPARKIHRWLEDLVWIEDFDLDEARALDIGTSLEAEPEARREALAALTEALQAPSVRAALSREACTAPANVALQVSNEHAFSLVLADQAGEEHLWNGSIDRLVLGRRGDEVVWAEVLDYKTDILTPTPDQLPALVEHYRPQLETYGRVVAAQTGLPASAIRLCLVFLELGRVVRI